MGGTRILDDEQIAEMCELRERGLSYERIAEHFTGAGTKISVGAIYWQCLRHGADAPKKGRGHTVAAAHAYSRNGHTVRPYTPDEDRQLQALSTEGLSSVEIAKRIPGRKPNSVLGRLATLARHDARAEEAQA